MKIEIWSDVVCPYCYIGKRQLEKALADLPDIEATIIWKSFELDPKAPEKSDLDIYDTLAKKYGKDREWALQMNKNMVKMANDAGLTFNMDDVKPTNSFKAHRLLHFAKTLGKSEELKEALLKAYFTDGAQLSDSDTLIRIAEKAGLPKEESQRVLNDKAFTDEIMQDVERAHQIGVRGVPFFLINEKYGLSGAQPVEVFKNALDQIHNEQS